MTKNSLPTGGGTSGKNDVADPHPSTEENYDKIRRPGRSNPPKKSDLGANSYTHDGKAPPHEASKGPNGKALNWPKHAAKILIVSLTIETDTPGHARRRSHLCPSNWLTSRLPQTISSLEAA